MEKATIYDYARMCREYHYTNCQSCPLWNEGYNLRMMNDTHLDKANEIILKWCEEHPVKTRQDRFLEMFPNAEIDTWGTIFICPQYTNKDFSCKVRENKCLECQKEYWLAEVDENDIK